jgi:hypothetical protein
MIFYQNIYRQVFEVKFMIAHEEANKSCGIPCPIFLLHIDRKMDVQSACFRPTFAVSIPTHFIPLDKTISKIIGVVHC